MAGQVPERGAMVLDHIGHFVPRIDEAAEAMRRCGFLLTPFSLQTNRVGGELVAAGTGAPPIRLVCALNGVNEKPQRRIASAAASSRGTKCAM